VQLSAEVLFTDARNDECQDAADDATSITKKSRFVRSVYLTSAGCSQGKNGREGPERA
jgi:hypothetical protein